MKWNALAILLVAFGFAAHADDWPQFRGPDRDGTSRERGFSSTWPAEGPEKLWQATVGHGWSSISVSGGRAYSMGNKDDTDSVFCFDAKSGQLIWTHSYPCVAKESNHGPRMTPTVDDNRVYTVSREGQLFCLSSRDGEVIWSKDYRKDFNATQPTWGWSGSPLVEGNLLIAEIGGPGSAVVAFDKKTGQIAWKSGDALAGYASPVACDLRGERCVLVFSGSGLDARRVKDGRVEWRFPWKTNFEVNAATPIVVGEKVFLTSAYRVGGALLDLSGPKPAVLWKTKQMAVHMSGPVYWGGHLYGFDESTLRCLNFQNGDVKWSLEGKYKKGSLLIADGKMVIFGGEGQLGLAEANPKSYHELAFVQPIGGKDTWSPPVLANGLLYLRGNESIVCLDIRGGETAKAQWSPLFPDNGVPKGWKVRDWSDVRRPGPDGAHWQVIDGVLHGSEPRGTWLVSEKEYGDFELEFEWKLGRRGNSGCGLRFPDYGDPAFDGLELQMVDPRYYPPEMTVPTSELTGSLYRGVAPSLQLFKPEAWNKYHIRLLGPNVTVKLNGERVLDVNLSEFPAKLQRHTGEAADALKDRPRRGRIGFQELSREGGHVEIRNARVRILD